ncbi:hypothetical protein [Gordonia rubripertincta]|uniref:hypothetical protein n=1 Tax=Gordonia rubripertincta TaxID=36822 RepID=UPI0015FDF200|nr:hypothetical protein [Gordonia rubripertincta]QMU22058.1 hypothetical protein H3V45_06085 [Gordonia rubripertincta]
MSAADEARNLPTILGSAGQHRAADQVARLLAELHQATADLAEVRTSLGRAETWLESIADLTGGDRYVDGVRSVMTARDAANATIQQVRELHEPIEALNVRSNQRQKVCAACGTDDGNWQLWPCPTVRLLDRSGS